MTRQGIGTWIAALLLAGAAGCATTSGGDPRDPWEGFNRPMHNFNEAFDDAIGKPVATTYRDVVPAQGRYWVRNFFANIGDIWIGANNLLQGKPLDAVTDWARFGFNTTIGLFGINDVASEMGIEKHDEDFGQTFGRWGFGDGPYLVWPFLVFEQVLPLRLAVDVEPLDRVDDAVAGAQLIVTVSPSSSVNVFDCACDQLVEIETLKCPFW